MDVIGVAPLEVGSLVWRDGALAPRLTVVCKATYRLLQGESRLAPEQEALRAEDEPMGGDPSPGLYAPCDLVPRKARAEVMLVGHAFAPRGEAVRSLVARLVVGAVDKEIEIFGDRAWTREGVLRDGGRFARMPLSWDRAAGGPGTSNPLGRRTGPAAQPDAQGAVTLPNLQPPGGAPGSRRDPIQPAGFGPLPASFPERLARLGRQAAAWLDAPLPEDFDLGYFNAAPADQQVPMLRDGERLILQNLHRDHPRLMTALPAARPRAFAERAGAPPREVGLRCDTLWIDTDRAICTLTWRGQLSLASRDEPGRVICALEEPGRRLAHEDVLALAGPAPAAPDPRPAPAAIEPPSVIELPPEDDQDGPSTLTFRGAPAAPTPDKGFVATSRVAAFVPAEALPFHGGPASPPATPAIEPPAPRGRGRAQTIVAPPTAAAQGPSWLNAPVPPELAGALAARRFGEPPPVPGGRRGRVEAPPAVVPPPAAVQAPVAARDTIELLWADPAAAPKIRRAFGDLLADLPPPAGADGDEARAERHEAAVMRVFSTGRRCDAAGLEDAMAGAVGPDARFRPPLVLVAGELRFTLEDVAPPQGRLLGEGRGYERRALLGGPRIRALLMLPGAEAACPVYLPDALSTVLPMLAAFEAQVIAQAHPSQDQAEAHPVALEALALGRVVAVGRRRQ